MATLIKYKQLLLDGKIQNDDLEGSIQTTKLADGADFIKRTGTVPFTANQSMGTNKLINLNDGTDPLDAINKSQLDGLESTINIQIENLEDLIAEGMRTPIPFDASVGGTWPTHTKGTTMKVTVPGTVSGVKLTIGDTIIYDADGSSPYVIQTNIDYATDEIAGYIRIATLSEVNTGSDNTTVVTPYTLAQRLASLVTSLYDSFVRYDVAQSLTAPQQAQARANINAAADDAVVKLTGNQTIAGIKTFSSSPVVPTAVNPDQAVNLGQVESLISSSSLDNLVFNEQPTGTINGVNTEFTLANPAVSGKLIVRLNGQVLTPTTDYTHTGSTITFVNAPDTVDVADVIRVDYVKA